LAAGSEADWSFSALAQKRISWSGTSDDNGGVAQPADDDDEDTEDEEEEEAEEETEDAGTSSLELSPSASPLCRGHRRSSNWCQSASCSSAAFASAASAAEGALSAYSRT